VSLDRLEIRPPAEIIGEVVAGRGTGLMTFITQYERTELYWSLGDLVLACSTQPDSSLAAFLVRKGLITEDQAHAMSPENATDVAERMFETSLVEDSIKQSLLREWTMSIVLPVFSLSEGTVAFESEDAIPPEKRIFIPSIAGLVLEGIRSITNGLVLKRSLGDSSRMIRRARESRFTLTNIPLNKDEMRIARGLEEPLRITELLAKFHGESALAARTIIAMMTLGAFEEHTEEESVATSDIDQSERDLELMVAIGPSDKRSLRAVGFARQMNTVDYYHLFDIPRAATRKQIEEHYENLKKEFDPATFPPVVRPTTQDIQARLDEAHRVLTTKGLRNDYDRLLAEGHGGNHEAIHRMLVKRSIAEENFQKASEHALVGQYFDAIVLLRQTVRYVPDHADAWYVLGTCQRHNPKWAREAMESMQRAISANPNFVEAILTLGDMYRDGGLTARARACYEDVLAIEPDHGEAATRLKTLKK
jgi:TolA-binding protein